jgi:hypothetical protein
MGRPFIRSEVIRDRTLTASETFSVDLGVNGISFLVVHLTGLQTAAGVGVQLDDLLAAITNITITNRGEAIWAGSARDLARAGAMACGQCPWITAAADAANAEVGCAFAIPFGRKLYGLTEFFPPVNRGDLQAQFTVAAAFGDIATPELNVQQVELPGVTSKGFLKCTTKAITPAATGQNDVPLPIGNILRNVLVFQTTANRNLNVPGTLDGATILLNNTERDHTGGFDVLDAWWGQTKYAVHPSLQESARVENTAGAYAQNASTRGEQMATAGFMHNYLLFDLDPTDDDGLSIDTKGLADFVLRMNVFTAAQAIRVLPLEFVGVGR